MAQLKMNNGEVSEDLLRHMIINSVRNYQKKYQADYGEIVLCTDASNTWRRDYFPQYKANRKKTRDASDMDWKKLFDTLQVVKEEIRDNFPYRYMYVETAEADDIIAILTKHAKEDVLIVSGDKDFQQLHKYDYVTQWSPNLNKMIKCDDPDTFLKEHILTGDKSDGIPNILSSDTCLDDRLLIKIGNILNQYEKSNIIIENSRKRLHKQISDKLSEMSQCNSEKCWLTIQEIISHLSPEELKLFKDSFKPKKPSEWDKDPNTWLTTSQLKLILEQLEQKYSNFKEYGALPMDFEKRHQSGCISGDLCNIDLQQHFRDQKHNIGVIFNLDDHDEPGSHWVSLYMDLKSKNREIPSIYYFDSFAEKPPKEIYVLVFSCV